MISTEKIINVVDAICDITPGVSTLTNGAQLLYKQAVKINKVVNPSDVSWKTELKIHIVNKSKFDCFVGLVPVIGNIARLIDYTLNGFTSQINGFTSQIKRLIISDQLELVKDHLKKYPLKNNPMASSVLDVAAFYSNYNVFRAVFLSRDWSADEILFALGKCNGPIDREYDKKINTMLQYASSKVKEPVSLTKIYIIHDTHKQLLINKNMSTIRAINAFLARGNINFECLYNFFQIPYLFLRILAKF